MSAQFTDDDYAQALHGLMPVGKAWSRDLDSVQSQVLGSLAKNYRRSGQAGLALLVDAFPASAVGLLPEWEESLGLPDPCAGEAPTIQARQRQVVARFTGQGGQSIAYVVAYAAALGYAVTVQQYAPFRCGQSSCGEPLCGPEWAYAWSVNAPLQSITYFRTGQSTVGEPLASWGNAVLECELQSIKPAHTVLTVTYS